MSECLESVPKIEDGFVIGAEQSECFVEKNNSNECFFRLGLDALMKSDISVCVYPLGCFCFYSKRNWSLFLLHDVN